MFPISIVSELLKVHPETIRVWEKNGIIKPQRRSGKRFYSETDLKKLRFVQRLMTEQLNLPAIRHYLRLYPCWEMEECPSCMHVSRFNKCSKPCWKEEGLYCQNDSSEDLCLSCSHCKKQVTEIT
jgi:DNA-binding transcriptional MerR regulator